MIQTKEYLYTDKNPLKYIEKIKKPLNKQKFLWCSSNVANSYRRYTEDSYYHSINNALRTGITDSAAVIADIENLDLMFNTLPEDMKNQRQIDVYRGMTFTSELKSALQHTNGTNILTEKGFISTSKDKKIAQNFAAMDDKVVMHIVIPEHSTILDDEQMPDSIRSAKRNEREVLLPRNAQFKILSYNPESNIIEAVYIGQKKPLKKPQFVYERSYDCILSDLNKSTIINPIGEFYNDKYANFQVS